jgi:hypothetical protein
MITRRHSAPDENGQTPGAPGRPSRKEGYVAGSRRYPDRQLGRRIEGDRTWTVYHAFTGAPAQAGGEPLTGLSHAMATDIMVVLNRRITAGRQARFASATAIRSPRSDADPQETRGPDRWR